MNPTSDYLGIDVSKDKIDNHFLGKGFALINASKGFAQLITKIQQHPNPVHVVCEATGPYHLPLVAALQKAGIVVSVLNPRQVRDFAKSKGILAKTDSIDARVLVDYAKAVQPRPTALLPDYWHQLVELVNRRSVLVTMSTAEKKSPGSKPFSHTSQVRPFSSAPGPFANQTDRTGLSKTPGCAAPA